MPCPYNIIFGRETAMPSPLYNSGATGIYIRRKFGSGFCHEFKGFICLQTITIYICD